MEAKHIKIEYTNYGIACRIGNTIIVNRALRERPELFEAIIRHEVEHTHRLALKDLILDLRIKQLGPFRKEYWKFVLTHPSSWTEFLPIGFYKGKILINPIILGFYGLVSLIVGLIGWWMTVW